MAATPGLLGRSLGIGVARRHIALWPGSRRLWRRHSGRRCCCEGPCHRAGVRAGRAMKHTLDLNAANRFIKSCAGGCYSLPGSADGIQPGTDGINLGAAGGRTAGAKADRHRGDSRRGTVGDHVVHLIAPNGFDRLSCTVTVNLITSVPPGHAKSLLAAVSGRPGSGSTGLTQVFSLPAIRAN